jgi:hypothetical protein
MGVGKHGMSHGESRSIQDALEWSPSKTQPSSHIATSAHQMTPKQKHASRKKSPAAMHQGKATKEHGTHGGGGGHHRSY